MEQYTNLLDLMMAYPEEFIDAALKRKGTSVIKSNKDRHKALAYALEEKAPLAVKEMLNDASYRLPLEGVCLSLREFDLRNCAMELYWEGKLVPTYDPDALLVRFAGELIQGHALGTPITTHTAKGTQIDEISKIPVMDKEQRRGITIRPQLMEDIEESQIDQ